MMTTFNVTVHTTKSDHRKKSTDILFYGRSSLHTRYLFMIDLTGLSTHDVEIRVQGSCFAVITQNQIITNDTLTLPKPIHSHDYSGSGYISVTPYGTDCIALAERLALHWESQGYKVKRIAAPLGTIGSNNEVQSFILA